MRATGVIIVLLIAVALASSLPIKQNLKRQSSFSYNRSSSSGPLYWGSLTGDSSCSGVNQSPVNIVQSATVLSPTFPPLTFSASPITTNLSNVGTTYVIAGVGNTTTITGGPLPAGDTYALQQITFHSPCEHLLNGYSATAEIQFVFQTLNAAHQGTSDPQRLAIISMIYEEGPQTALDDPFLSQFISNFPSLQSGGAGEYVSISINFTAFNGRNINNYYTYFGSLTTPPCNEVVTWIVLSGTAQISPLQAQYFETNLAVPMSNRPVQSLNSRAISRGFNLPMDTCVAAPPGTLSSNGAVAAAAATGGNLNLNYADLLSGFTKK